MEGTTRGRKAAKPYTSKIREARLQAGLTQQQVFDLIGIPMRTLQDWENGRRQCPEWNERLIIAEIARIGEKLHTDKA